MIQEDTEHSETKVAVLEIERITGPGFTRSRYLVFMGAPDVLGHVQRTKNNCEDKLRNRYTR